MKPLQCMLVVALALFVACSSPEKSSTDTENITEAKSLVGYVDLTDPLDMEMVQQGTELFIQKCAQCHTVDTVEFAVPAFAGVTNRRSPEWIMNMIINVDEMLKGDPVAAGLLRKHKKVMPDPNLTVAETRAVLEFLRQNDLDQTGEKDLAAGQ